MKISGERLESLYTTMMKIRRFDERTVELFNQGLVKGTARTPTSARRRSRPAPARRCARTTTSSGPTAATAIASPRARGWTG